MPRQARLDTPGTLHPVMVRGIERRAIVEDEADRGDPVERSGRLASELKTAVYCVGLANESCPLVPSAVAPEVTDLHAPLAHRLCPGLQPASSAPRPPLRESLPIHRLRGSGLVPSWSGLFI